MAQSVKQFTYLAAISLVAVFASIDCAIAQPQDIKAQLLSEIGFQYAELGATEQAIEVLDQALQSTQAMDTRCFQANPLAKIAGGYLLVGQDSRGQQLLADAIQVAKAQAALNCSGSATSPTESLLGRAREYADAGHLDLAIELSSRLGDPISLTELVGPVSEAGQSQRATALLKQAIEIAQSIDDDYHKAQTLIVMAQRLRLAGQTGRVPLVLEQAIAAASTSDSRQSSTQASLQATSALQIAEEFAAIDAAQSALNVLNQVLPKIRALSNQPFPLDKTIYQIDAALQYASLGQKSQSVALLTEAHTRAQNLSSDATHSRGDALGRVAEAYATGGDMEQARRIVRSIQPQVMREIGFQRIAVASVKLGDVDQAVELAKLSGSRRNATLIEIVRHYLTYKQPEQAWNFVQTQQVQGILSEVAVGYLEAGQPEQALQLVQTGKLEGFMPEVAIGYGKAGQPERALQLVENQQLEWLLPDIASKLAQQGQLDSALQVSQAISDKYYKARALIAIAKSYTQNDRTAQAGIQTMVARLVDFIQGLLGDSKQEKVAEVLNQALRVTQSMSEDTKR